MSNFELTDQGTNSDKGTRWVERIVSLRQTCQLQGKSSFLVLVEAMNASFKEQLPELEKGGFMNDIQCLSHTKWDCKFHVVWIPKCRRKMLYGQLRKNLGEVFQDLARQSYVQV